MKIIRKGQTEAGVMGQWVKYFTTQAQRPDFDTQDPHKNTGVVVHVCNLSAGRDTWVPEAPLPGRPANRRAPGPSEREPVSERFKAKNNTKGISG